MNPLSSSIDFCLNGFYICMPNTIGSSMRMTHVVSEMSTFSTNTTFCHDQHLLDEYSICFFSDRNNSILTERKEECKQKVKKYEKIKVFISFFPKRGYNKNVILRKCDFI